MIDTHYIPPAGRMDTIFNSSVRWLADRGINLAGAQTLTVVGRKSGAPQRVPVNPLPMEGAEFLVAVRGNTQWVRNARAAGRAELRRGRRVRTVGLRELPESARVPVIRAYLSKWGWEVSRYLPDGLTVDSDDDTFATHAHKIPVFELTPAA